MTLQSGRDNLIWATSSLNEVEFVELSLCCVPKLCLCFFRQTGYYAVLPSTVGIFHWACIPSNVYTAQYGWVLRAI